MAATALKSEKACCKCKETKPLEAFSYNQRSKDSRQLRCKVCSVEASMAWQRRNRERKAGTMRDWRLRRLYDLSQADFDAMVVKQEGLCACCGRRPMEGKALHVDHDHESDVVRGLLCSTCNTGLGKFGDNFYGITKALSYLLPTAKAPVEVLAAVEVICRWRSP